MFPTRDYVLATSFDGATRRLSPGLSEDCIATSGSVENSDNQNAVEHGAIVHGIVSKLTQWGDPKTGMPREGWLELFGRLWKAFQPLQFSSEGEPETGASTGPFDFQVFGSRVDVVNGVRGEIDAHGAGTLRLAIRSSSTR